VKETLAISSLLALICAGLALVLLVFSQDGPGVHARVMTGVIFLILAAIWSLPVGRQGGLAGLICCLAVAAGAWAVLFEVHHLAEGRTAEIAIWVFVLGLGFLAWRGMELLSAMKSANRYGKWLLGSISIFWYQKR